MTNLVERVAGNPDFSILVAALGYVDTALPGSGLVSALSAPEANLTVFAPTNAAFGQLAADLGYEGDTSNTTAVTEFLIEAVPAETLRDVLLYHVSAGTQNAAQVASAGTITTLQGGTFTFDNGSLVDQEPDLADPTLIATDIAASNGIAHVIDRILLPIDLPGNSPAPEPDPAPLPTIAGIVASSGDGFDDNDGDFDMLLAAAKAAGLVDALNDPNASLTAFAPTDAAFVGLSQALGYGASDEAGAWDYLVEALTLLGGGDPIPLLQTVLKYHVAPGSLDAATVLASTEIGTLAGASVGVDGTTLVDADPDIANPNIIATDIAAANGTVHVIDGVLLPADLLQSDGSNDVDFIIGDDTREHIWTGRDADYIDGNGGNDSIYAGRGNDIVLGGDGHDYVNAGRGDDVVFGGEGNDYITGRSGDDKLSGDAGNDRIYGGWGNDTIDGGAGNDKLSGGWGRDVFVFGEGDGHDYICDFRNHSDKIDLSGAGFADYDDLRDSVHTGWWRSTIELDSGDTLTVRGLNWWNISEDDFIL